MLWSNWAERNIQYVRDTPSRQTNRRRKERRGRRNSYGVEFTKGEETPDKRRTKYTAATPIKRQKGRRAGRRGKEGRAVTFSRRYQSTHDEEDYCVAREGRAWPWAATKKIGTAAEPHRVRVYPRVCAHVYPHMCEWARARALARARDTHVCAAYETDTLQPRRNMRGRPREGKSEETPSRSSLNRSQSIRSRAMSAAWIIAARVADSTGVDHSVTLDLFPSHVNRCPPFYVGSWCIFWKCWTISDYIWILRMYMNGIARENSKNATIILTYLWI